MDITTPALLFPAISLLFVAYTNRLHSLSVLIRSMTTEGSNESKTKHAKEQSFIFCLFTIIGLYLKQDDLANYIFGFGLLMLVSSLLFALAETLLSTKALDIHLNNSNF